MVKLVDASLLDLNSLRKLEAVCFPQDAWPLLDLMAVLSFSEFAKRDGERTLKSQAESARMTEENISGTAKKLGLSLDELKRANQEVIDRFGWNDKTSFAEVLQELHRATFNSPVMKQAYMNNTNEGLRLQIDELKTDPNWGTDTPKGRQLVQRRIELLDKMGQLSQKK